MANDTCSGSEPRIKIPAEEIPKIIGYRRTNRSDIPRICQMKRIKTCDLFGEVEVGRVFERACLSLVQINEQQEVVSNVSLCNFPNVSSVPASDWLSWITMHYEVPDVVERSTLFIHLLVWDARYNETFFKAMLNDVFVIASYCLHVITIVPPGIQSDTVDLFDRNMTRFVPRCEMDNLLVQTLYVAFKYQENPKLKIRRVVEEDNDDLIPIINAESKLLRELYGEFYISEILRHEDDENRQLIVAESKGQATGVMCLTRNFNVDILNENYELIPYGSLRKSLAIEPSIVKFISPTGSTSSSSGLTKTASEVLQPQGSKEVERERFSQAIAQTIRLEDSTKGESDPEGSPEPILTISTVNSSRPSRASPSVNFESVLRTSVFAEAIYELPTRSLASSAYNDDDDDDRGISQFSEKTEQEPCPRSNLRELNAFTLELFSMDHKIDEQHGQDYLEAAFDCFPDLDYCIMLLPSTQPHFSFLDNFIRVPLRFDKDFPMVLYVTHRATLLGFLKARAAVPYDRKDVVNFLQGIPKKRSVLEDVQYALEYPEGDVRCYIFTCDDTIIGLAVICYELRIDDLCLMYNVEDYISMEHTSRDAHAQILHFILTPIFSVHHGFLFCELMRLSSTTVLFYRLYHSETMAISRNRPLITCLDAMIPACPRPHIYQPYPENKEKLSPSNEEKFSLFLMNPRLAMMPKRVINSKVVIVGASDCGVACAEYLVFQEFCLNVAHFTNLTLVSPNGLPFEGKTSVEHATMIPFRGRYCYDYRKVVPSRAWINVVHGFLSHINRKERYVTISGLGILSYDYLVLTCGLQYQSPKSNRDDREPNGKGDSQETNPLNCFCINDDVDAVTCLERLKELTNDFTIKKFIVIYGWNIECLCTMNTLMESGIKGSWIIMIQPQFGECGKSSDIFFEDERVTEAIEKSILDCGVKILVGWDLKDWIIEPTANTGENENGRSSLIKSLRIESKQETKLVACDALIYFGDKRIPMKTFMGISRAGLVFDGLLVIDPDYRTNDPYVFAAGAITKYSRKFRAESWQHQYYNSIEIGERLAQNLKQRIDSYSTNYEEESDPQISQSGDHAQINLPVFRAPIIVYCRLPGGLHYLHVRKPGKKIARVVEIARGTYGQVLETGSTLNNSSNSGYFRIRLNPFNTVETITCLRKENFRVLDLITLYGKHDTMLNNLKIRFQNSLIPDFFAYFAEPWAAALYHDKFDRLRMENRATLLSKTDIYPSFIQDALSTCGRSDWKEMKDEYIRQTESRYVGSVYQDAISSNVINFLQSEEQLLPMYCNPRKLRRQLMEEDD